MSRVLVCSVLDEASSLLGEWSRDEHDEADEADDEDDDDAELLTSSIIGPWGLFACCCLCCKDKDDESTMSVVCDDDSDDAKPQMGALSGLQTPNLVSALKSEQRRAPLTKGALKPDVTKSELRLTLLLVELVLLIVLLLVLLLLLKLLLSVEASCACKVRGALGGFLHA